MTSFTNNNTMDTLFTSKFSSDLLATNHTVSTEGCNSSQSESLSSFSSFQYDDSKKRVQFPDDDGEELCEIFIVQDLSDYPDLWWTPEQLRKMKTDCHEIATRIKENEEFCDAVVDMLMQGVKCVSSSSEVQNFINKMTTFSEARGLEPHIVSPCKRLADIHYDAVFDAQQEAYDRGLYGTEKGDWAVCQASLQTSRPFEVLAFRQAQYDTREAMRAAFSRWNSESILKGSKKQPRTRRRNSMARSASAARCMYT